jgi:hypothetical protein
MNIDRRLGQRQHLVAQRQRGSENVHDVGRGRQANVAGPFWRPGCHHACARIGGAESEGTSTRNAGELAGSDPSAVPGLANEVRIGDRGGLGRKGAVAQEPEAMLALLLIVAVLHEVVPEDSGYSPAQVGEIGPHQPGGLLRFSQGLIGHHPLSVCRVVVRRVAEFRDPDIPRDVVRIQHGQVILGAANVLLSFRQLPMEAIGMRSHPIDEGRRTPLRDEGMDPGRRVQIRPKQLGLWVHGIEGLLHRLDEIAEGLAPVVRQPGRSGSRKALGPVPEVVRLVL